MSSSTADLALLLKTTPSAASAVEPCDTFLYSVRLQHSEDEVAEENDDATSDAKHSAAATAKYDDPNADWHISTAAMAKSFHALLEGGAAEYKFTKAKTPTLQLLQYRYTIKKVMQDQLGMPEKLADIIADIMERSAYHVILPTITNGRVDHRTTDVNYRGHYLADARRVNWLLTEIEQVLAFVNSPITSEVTKKSFNPVLACHDTNGYTVHIDKDLPDTYQDEKTIVPAKRFLVFHEIVEFALMKKLNLRYQDAHQVAERSEKVAVLAQGFDWEKYDAFMQTHIKRVMAQNKVNADLIDSSVIQRDANGKVTNLEEIITSFQQKMAENIELFDKRLLPPGMNSDPLKVYADQSPTENDTSDQDVLVYAFTKASQQLYPERMAEDDYDHAPPEWITEITRPMLQR